MDTILYANDIPLGQIAGFTMHQAAIEFAPDWLLTPDELGGRYFRPGTASWEVTVTKPTAFAYTLQVAALYVFTLGEFSPAITQRQGGKVVALETSPDAVTLSIHPALS